MCKEQEIFISCGPMVAARDGIDSFYSKSVKTLPMLHVDSIDPSGLSNSPSSLKSDEPYIGFSVDPGHPGRRR